MAFASLGFKKLSFFGKIMDIISRRITFFLFSLQPLLRLFELSRCSLKILRNDMAHLILIENRWAM